MRMPRAARGMLRPGQIPHQPEHHPPQAVAGGEGKKQAHHRPVARRQHHPGEQQALGVPLATPHAQGQQQRHAGQGAAESAEIDQPHPGPQGHGGQGAHRGAAGDAQDIRFRQRVAQQHLEQHPGQGQQPAAGEGGEQPRQAQLPHDVRRQGVGGAGQEGVENLVKGKVGAARREAGQQAGRGEEQQYREDEA